jgi:hypothetical protein
MKILFLLTLLVAFVIAVELDLEPNARGRRHESRKTSRPKRFTGQARMGAARRPDRAPSGYTCGTDKPSFKRGKTNLKKLPSEYLDKRSFVPPHQSPANLGLLPRQATGADFYECYAAVGCLTLTSSQIPQIYQRGKLIKYARIPNPARQTVR